MAGKNFVGDQPAGLSIPQARLAIARGGGNHGTIDIEDGAIDEIIMLQDDRIAAGRIPDTDGVIPGSRNDSATIGAILRCSPAQYGLRGF